MGEKIGLLKKHILLNFVLGILPCIVLVACTNNTGNGFQGSLTQLEPGTSLVAASTGVVASAARSASTDDVTLNPNCLHIDIAQGMVVDESGNVYTGDTKGSAWEYYKFGLTWNKVAGLESKDAAPVNAMAIDNLGNIYAAKNDGRVWIYSESGGWTSLHRVGGNNQAVTALYASESGAIYAGTNNGFVYKYVAYAGWRRVGGILGGGSIEWIMTDRAGRLYADTEYGNVFRNSSGTWRLFWNAANKHDLVISIASDQYNNLYLATYHGNIWEASAGNPQQETDIGPGLNSHGVFSVATDESGNVYAGTYGGLVYEYQTGAESWNLLPGNPGACPDSAGCVENDSVSQIISSPPDLIYAMMGDGDIWQYSPQSGWNQLLTHVWTQIGNTNGIPIQSLYMDKYNHLYVGGADTNGSIWMAESGQLTLSTTLISTIPSAANQVGLGQFLLNGYGGICATDIFKQNIAGTSCENVNISCFTGNGWTTFGGAIPPDNCAYGVVGAAAIYESTVYVSMYNTNESQGMLWQTPFNESQESWESASNPVNSELTAIAFNESGTIYVTGANGDLYLGSAMIPVTGINNLVSIFANTVNDNLYGLYNNGVIQQFVPESMVLVASQLPSAPNFAAVDNTNNAYALVNGILWKHLASESTGPWVELPVITSDNSAINAITVGESSNVYAGTANGNLWKWSTTECPLQ